LIYLDGATFSLNDLDIGVAAMGDFGASYTLAAGPLLVEAVQSLGEVKGQRPLAYLGRACQKVSVGNPIIGQGTFQQSHSPLMTYHLPHSSPRTTYFIEYCTTDYLSFQMASLA